MTTQNTPTTGLIHIGWENDLPVHIEFISAGTTDDEGEIVEPTDAFVLWVGNMGMDITKLTYWRLLARMN